MTSPRTMVLTGATRGGVCSDVPPGWSLVDHAAVLVLNWPPSKLFSSRYRLPIPQLGNRME